MKFLISIQYPIAVVEIPKEVNFTFDELKIVLDRWLYDGNAESVINSDDAKEVLDKIVLWIEEFADCQNGIKVITDLSDCDIQKFSNKETVFI